MVAGLVRHSHHQGTKTPRYDTKNEDKSAGAKSQRRAPGRIRQAISLTVSCPVVG